ncbi:MAG: L-ribulose-5-phosphate 4-epimerase [Elusimicrobia bacterium CG_4_10_14_0_8_um_filter_37_32]|nr:MAG: L-ribulose-5-phosphate 4-epimerase [Elusimicrobia bacterium CG02_land_8_20_14_3_00_37_13]PIZ13933.1 MAG: L-ribulose-5-phosphate 4-epimerase [Elusimicrobia bacterium CG_4_10_14_0_8_um_filter_37_32]
MLLKDLRKEVYEMNMELPKNNLVTLTNGNVSGRDTKTDYVVIKPSGVKFEELSVENMVIVNLSGKVIEGKLKPSVDTLSHLVVYRNRKDIFGIVHTHSPYATSFAILNQPLPVYMTSHADQFGETIPVAGYAPPLPLEEVGKTLVRALNDYSKRPKWILKRTKILPAILLRNHGVFCFGESATKALKSAVRIEEIAKTYHFALLRGKPKVLPEKEIKKWYYRYHNIYGQPEKR